MPCCRRPGCLLCLVRARPLRCRALEEVLLVGVAAEGGVGAEEEEEVEVEAARTIKTVTSLLPPLVVAQQHPGNIMGKGGCHWRRAGLRFDTPILSPAP